MTAADLIAHLGLQPHPEGGHYRETFRDPKTIDGRSVSSAIYYLLAAGERSHWHRIDAVEVWHWYGGGPLELAMPDELIVLGPDVAAGQRPQGIVPAGVWQAARPLGDWTLVGCTVAPAFLFEHFEMAPLGWRPPTG
jgi:predicted cupin superfamily sugar epimerase